MGRLSEVWETMHWISHDSYLAIGDASIPALKQHEALRVDGIGDRVMDATKNGVPVVAVFTEADVNIPVEVQRNEVGRIVALRLCWTTDVDELEQSGEGGWDRLTTLPLPKGSCVVWDPFHGEIEDGLVVDVWPGDYDAEVFYTEGDCLALRITATTRSG